MFDLKININGIHYERSIDPSMSLLNFIRNEIGLKGTKEGCGEGECGACTVMVDGTAVDSCLMFAAQCHEKDITTIEGIGSGNRLDPIQEAFINGGAVQCGFCIPGMVISAKAMLNKNPNPTDLQIRESISGNLCRCTGYNKIFTSIKEAANVYGNIKSDKK